MVVVAVVVALAIIVAIFLSHVSLSRSVTCGNLVFAMVVVAVATIDRHLHLVSCGNLVFACGNHVFASGQ